MMKPHISNQGLFFICPFSQVEHFIRKEFGDAFFITAPASIFNFKEEEFALAIKTFILKHNISEFYFVADQDCPFVTNALSDGTIYGLSCEFIIEDLMDDLDDARSLSEKIIRSQLKNFQKTIHWKDLIAEQKIKVHGILVSKKDQSLNIIA